MTQGIAASLLSKKIEENDKDIMVSRLTKNSNSDLIQQAMLSAEQLRDTIASVMRIGYGTRAPNGATILVPLSCEEVDRMELQPFDLVHHRKDLTFIQQALKQIPKSQRPKVKEEQYANKACSSAGGDVDICSLIGYEIHIENTFVMVRSMKG